MGGWPSTTGNPSGGGRWNNEPDDGYDDYEEEYSLEDGGYSTRRVYSNYTPPSPAVLRANQIEEMWNQYRNDPEKKKMRERVKELKDEMGYLGRAIGKEYWGYSSWSDMDDIAIKYFKCQSMSEFSRIILNPLDTINKKIEAFNKEYCRDARRLEARLTLPKLSETDHICRKAGFTEYQSYNSENGYEYIWKKDWNDAEESIHFVDRRGDNHDITKEELDNHEMRKAEFVDLQRTKETIKKRALDAYTLFRPNRRNTYNRHFMERDGLLVDEVLFSHDHELKDVDDDLMKIHDLIMKDWEELNDELSSLINEIEEMETKQREAIESSF